MLANWTYRPNGSIVQRFDPRARLIFLACYLVSVFLFWDLRILVLFDLFALGLILVARLTWRETSRIWISLGIFVVVYSLITLLTGSASLVNVHTEHIILTAHAPFTLFGWQPGIVLSEEQLFLALSQLARVFSIASMTILLLFTLDPALYGVTFRRLGLPDKVAFAIDLTMRFVPSLSRDFTLTIDAQRARGYELESHAGGLVERMRRLAPLLVPVVIHSVVGAEEITDAMDLRGFGTRPRTWLRELRYTSKDYILIGCAVLLLIVSIVAHLLGYGGLWIPG
jgi:energy-coupling factor transport system permease protein